MITVNMSEYQEAHTVSALRGAPPGYVGYGRGGVLTEAVKRRPYSVVLLDEIEKAHPDVLELFYQVFDRGLLEDGEGFPVDFRHTIILLTSNLGADEIDRVCGEARSGGRPAPATLLDALRPILEQHLKPALLARMVVVPYYPLSPRDLRRIARLKLERVSRRFAERHRAELHVDDSVIETLTQRCIESANGARELDHLITQTMLPELSSRILGILASGQGVRRARLTLDERGMLQYDVVTTSEAERA